MDGNVITLREHLVARRRMLNAANNKRADFERLRQSTIEQIRGLVSICSEMQSVDPSKVISKCIETLETLANAAHSLTLEDPKASEHCDTIISILSQMSQVVTMDARTRAL